MPATIAGDRVRRPVLVLGGLNRERSGQAEVRSAESSLLRRRPDGSGDGRLLLLQPDPKQERRTGRRARVPAEVCVRAKFRLACLSVATSSKEKAEAASAP